MLILILKNFVNINIKNSIDLYSGHSTKDLTTTSTSSYKNYKNTHTDNSLNVKNYKSRDVPENRKLPEHKNSGNGATDFTITSSSYNDYRSNNTVENTPNANNDKSPSVLQSRNTQGNENKRVFILSDNIVKYISGYDISRQIENFKAFVKGFSSAKTECMKV